MTKNEQLKNNISNAIFSLGVLFLMYMIWFYIFCQRDKIFSFVIIVASAFTIMKEYCDSKKSGRERNLKRLQYISVVFVVSWIIIYFVAYFSVLSKKLNTSAIAELTNLYQASWGEMLVVFLLAFISKLSIDHINKKYDEFGSHYYFENKATNKIFFIHYRIAENILICTEKSKFDINDVIFPFHVGDIAEIHYVFAEKAESNKEPDENQLNKPNKTSDNDRFPLCWRCRWKQ